MPHPHRIHFLPKSHPDPTTWAQLITAQKDFRLHALRATPESFSSTFAREAIFTPSEWQARLQNPLALTLVAIRPPPTEATEAESESRGAVQDCIEGAWQGMAVLYGPSHHAAHNLPMYEIFGLFVQDSVRGEGIGTSLIKVAVEEAVARSGNGGVVVRVRVAAGNAKVVRLYEKSGFSVEQGKEEEEGEEVVMEMKRGA
jgi:GNAT superfamily N-acetyltransferase